MTVTIKIKCDNAAFGDFPGEEVNRILKDAGERLQADLSPAHIGTFPLMDINGNRVGSVKVSK